MAGRKGKDSKKGSNVSDKRSKSWLTFHNDQDQQVNEQQCEQGGHSSPLPSSRRQHKPTKNLKPHKPLTGIKRKKAQKKEENVEEGNALEEKESSLVAPPPKSKYRRVQRNGDATEVDELSRRPAATDNILSSPSESKVQAITIGNIVETKHSNPSMVKKLQRDIAELKKMCAVHKMQIATQRKVIDEQNVQIAKSSGRLKELLIEKSIAERRMVRQKSVKDRMRLGQFKGPDGDEACPQLWTVGSAFQQLYKREEKLRVQRENLDEKKKILKKKQAEFRASNKNSADGANGGNDGKIPKRIGSTVATSSETNFIYGTSLAQEIYQRGEMIKVQQAAWRKADAECQAQKSQLLRERTEHADEIKRIRSEDDSPFCGHPILKDRYLLLTLIGKGGYAEVYKAYDLKEHKYVACKVHEPDCFWSDSKKKSFLENATKEYQIQQALNHPRLVKVLEAFEIAHKGFCGVLELCEGGDLETYLRVNKTIPENEARIIIMQVASALKYLNEIIPAVIHYDIKPGNIMIANANLRGEVKLTDFGLARHYIRGFGLPITSRGAGTMWYLPPECFAETDMPQLISSKVDVWSLGVTFYQCLYGEKPFGENLSQSVLLREKTILKAKEVRFNHVPVVSAEAKDFIKKCLAFNQRDRMDPLELVRHPYMKSSMRIQKLRSRRLPPPDDVQPSTSRHAREALQARLEREAVQAKIARVELAARQVREGHEQIESDEHEGSAENQESQEHEVSEENQESEDFWRSAENQESEEHEVSTPR